MEAAVRCGVLKVHRAQACEAATYSRGWLSAESHIKQPVEI
jgi:hypothetical protein